MAHRYFFQNMIDAGTAIAASSVSPGFTGGAVPRVAQGSGSVVFSGAFTGEGTEIYTVEIDAEGDVGAATFKWRKSTTAPPGTFEASGVLTALTNILLDQGVSVRFAAGASTPHFRLADRWQASASRFRSPGKIFDLDPATKWRTANPPSDPESLVLDLGAAKAPDALILHAHNLSAAAAIRIQGNGADSWGAPAVDEAVTWRADSLVHYLTSAPRSHRYWRLLLAGDAANADGFLEIGEVYLGGYFEPAFHFAWGGVLTEEAFEESRETESRVQKTALLNRGRAAALPYEHVSAAQKDLFLAMYRAVKDVAAERSKPLFVHLDVDDPGTLLLANVAAPFTPEEQGPDDFAFRIELRERLT
ncbi:MAG: hypothetical protein O2807_10380 [bacterium]|nr:hypothetical protein [bacterium]